MNVPEPGAYRVTASKKGCSFPYKTSITVTDTGGHGEGADSLGAGGSAQDYLIEGDVLGITTTHSALTTCTIYGYVAGAGGHPVDQAVIWLDTLANPYLNGGGGGVDAELVLPTRERLEIRSDVTGFWAVDVPQGTTVKLSMPHMSYSKQFVVPALATSNIRDIRQEVVSSVEDMSSV